MRRNHFGFRLAAEVANKISSTGDVSGGWRF
jgi:hypothetical protein